MNQRFNLKQRVAAWCMAAMMCCTMFPIGAFAEAPQPDADGTPIVVQDDKNVTPDAPQTDESNPDPGENTPEDSETPMVTQSADEDKPVDDSTDYTFDGAVLYTDLPDAPTGSYMGSQGLPVATGETKIGISAWPNDQLEESADSYLSADTLNSDDLTPEGGYDFTSFFDDIRPTVQQYDLACINQETILVKDRNLIESYPVFGSPIEVADALADAGFNVVTFASNHCYDKKETGITDTLSYFHETYPEITTLGIHDTEADAAAIPIVEKNGIRIAMLNFTYGLNNSMPEKRWMVDTLSSRETVCGRIEQAKQEADFVIVFPHWGTEDTFSPDNDQLTWAQEMADAGADLIIGGHTHTLQPVELLTAADGRDVPVYYSLGNFLSHQKEKMNLLGGMASVTIVKDADGTHVSEYDLQPTVNVILRNANTGWYTYRPMLLDSYSSDLAAQNRFSECTVDAMWALYEDITG